MSEEKYEITKEAILKMAEKCPEAKSVLEAGFPQAFEKEKGKHFDLTKLKDGNFIFTATEARTAGFKDIHFMKVRAGSEYRGIAFLLEEDYLTWDLVRDNSSRLCLTVERKDYVR